MAALSGPTAIGIDLGSAESYVASVSKGHLDLVQNEVSQRATSSLVGFTDRERLLGEPAAAQIKSNAVNTCRDFKSLLGRRLEAPDLEEERSWSTSALCACADGSAGFEVSYRGESRRFSAVEITAMYFTKLRETAEKWCGGRVADAVIAVPASFTDAQRQAVLDAAEIAELRVLRLMNEHAATALAYGATHADEFDEEMPKTVAFCSMGHTNFNVAIAQFVSGHAKVLGHRSGKVGARDLEACLLRECAEQFKKQTGLDALASKKAALKLEAAVAKAKKVLSANSDASVSVECLMEDEDFSMTITREHLERLCEPARRRAQGIVEAALEASGLTAESVDVVELAGGGSRIPWVRRLCSEAFGGKGLSTTVNQEESVARGCALQAAMLSSGCEVTKTFDIADVSAYAVKVHTGDEPAGSPNSGDDDAMDDGEDEEGDQKEEGDQNDDDDEPMQCSEEAERQGIADDELVLPEGSELGAAKTLTFSRSGPFDVRAELAGEGLPPLVPVELGNWHVELPEQDEPTAVEVRVRLTANGMFEVESAVTSSGEVLEITAGGRPGLGAEALRRLRAAEVAMQADMREVVETDERKNDLEAYILALRNKCSDPAVYAELLPQELREATLAELAKAEDWLYETPDATKAMYAEKQAQMQVIGEALARRAEDAKAQAIAKQATVREAKQQQHQPSRSSKATGRRHTLGGTPAGGRAEQAAAQEQLMREAARRAVPQQAQPPMFGLQAPACGSLQVEDTDEDILQERARDAARQAAAKQAQFQMPQSARTTRPSRQPYGARAYGSSPYGDSDDEVMQAQYQMPQTARVARPRQQPYVGRLHGGLRSDDESDDDFDVIQEQRTREAARQAALQQAGLRAPLSARASMPRRQPFGASPYGPVLTDDSDEDERARKAARLARQQKQAELQRAWNRALQEEQAREAERRALAKQAELERVARAARAARAREEMYGAPYGDLPFGRGLYGGFPHSGRPRAATAPQDFPWLSARGPIGFGGLPF